MSEPVNGEGAPPAAPQDPQQAEAQAPEAAEAPPLSREELDKKVKQLSAMLEESMSRARETQERDAQIDREYHRTQERTLAALRVLRDTNTA